MLRSENCAEAEMRRFGQESGTKLRRSVQKKLMLVSKPSISCVSIASERKCAEALSERLNGNGVLVAMTITA